jgi:hypothetical protein
LKRGLTATALRNPVAGEQSSPLRWSDSRSDDHPDSKRRDLGFAFASHSDDHLVGFADTYGDNATASSIHSDDHPVGFADTPPVASGDLKTFLPERKESPAECGRGNASHFEN